MRRPNKVQLLAISILILGVLAVLAITSTKAEPFNPCITFVYPEPNQSAAYPYPYPYPEPDPSCSFMPVIFKNW
jgi:hypothetical protein